MYNAHKRYAMFIGRWQPFHNGHKFIIDKAIDKGENICIAIRNTEISEKNPYTVEQRVEMIRRVYGNKVEVVVIPDIKSINIGRKVGYEVNRVDPPSDIGAISGTKVRAGECGNIPQAIAEYIKSLRTTLWLTGLPCSGKTTLSKRLKEELDNHDYKAVCLDGDDVRGRLNADLGFSGQDRNENLRRVAHIAKLFNENGNFVIASFVSPTNELRDMVKGIIGDFKIVYLKCSVQTCEKRDVKGMYKKARKGEIEDFTGISAPFEEPENPFLIVNTEEHDVETCVQQILQAMDIKQHIDGREYVRMW